VTDLATLGIEVDSTKVVTADQRLEDLANTGAKAEGATKKLTTASNLLAAGMSGLGAAVAAVSFTALIDDAKNFNRAMADVSTQVDTAVFDMKRLQKAALDQAAAFNSQPLEQSKALYDIISAGAKSSADAIETLNAANKLAVGGNTDVATAADGLTSVMNAYAGKIKDVTEASDILFAANRIGKTTIDELASSIGVVAPIAAELGVNFDELAIAAGALTAQGIDTSTAMQGLRALLSSIAKPSEEAKDMAKALGLEYTTAALKAKGLAGFLGELQAKTGGNAEALSLLVGGVEALLPTMTLLGSASQNFATGLESSRKTAEETEAAFDKIAKSGAYQLEAIMGRLNTAAVGFAVTLLDKAVPALTELNKWLDGITKPTLAVEFAMKAMGVTITALAVKAVVGLTASMVASTPFFALYIGSITSVGVVSATATVATTALGIAIKAALGPIGLAITAVGLLAGAWTLYKDANEQAEIANKDLYDAINLSNKAVAAQTGVTMASTIQKLNNVEMTRRQIAAELELARANGQAAIGRLGQFQGGAARSDIADLSSLREAANARTAVAVAEKAIAENLAEQAKLRKGIVSIVEGEVAGAKAAALAAKGQTNAAAALLKVNQDNNRVKREGVSEAEKAKNKAKEEYDTAVKGGKDYLVNLRQQIEEIGKTTYELKELAAARAIASIPPDQKALIQSIKDETANWIAATKAQLAKEAVDKSIADAVNKLTESIKEQNAAGKAMLADIQFETSLMTMNAQQRAVAIVMRDLETAGIVKGTEAWGSYAQAIIDAATATGAANLKTDELEYMSTLMDDIADRADSMASRLEEAFGNVGKAIGGAVSAFTNYGSVVAAVDAKLNDDRKKYAGDNVKLARAEVSAANERRQAEVAMYGDMLGSAKHFFDEKSKGYKLLEGAERAFRAIEAAMQLKALAQDIMATGKTVLNSGIRAAAKGAEAFANAIKDLPFPANLAAGAAVVAALAAVGVKLVGGGGRGGAAAGATDAADRQAAQGSGSVLGDATAASESLSRSLAIAAANSNKDLEYSNQMVKSLKAIEGNIGLVSAALSRSMTGGGVLDTSKLGIGASASGNFFLGGTKNTTLQDQGLTFLAQTLGDILTRGIQGNAYQQTSTTKTKSFLGITYSNSTSQNTNRQNLPTDLQEEITALIGSLKAGVLSAASILGVSGAEAALDAFAVNIGNISLKDMSGAEITAALNSIFSKVGDDLAASVIPGIVELQQVGEGAFETLTRLAREYQVVDMALSAMGKTFGLVGVASIAARDQLVQLSGGLDAFTDQARFFVENFLTEAEQMAPIMAAVQAEMARLGVSGVDTKEEFKALVLGLDLATESGAATYASLMAVAPAFLKVTEYTDELNKSLLELANAAVEAAEKQVKAADDLVKSATEALEQAYQRELQAANQRLNEARQQITKAENDILAAYNRQVEVLTQQIVEANSKVDAARQALGEAFAREAANLNTKLGETISAVSQAEATLLDSYNRQVDAITQQLNSNNQAVENARSALSAAFDRQIETLSDQLSAATDKVSDAEGALLSAYNRSVATIQQGIADANAAVDRARQVVVDAFARDIAAASQRLESAKSLVAAATSALQEAYDRTVAEITSSIAAANERVATATAKLADAFGREIDAMSQRVNEAATAVETARSNLQAAYNKSVADITASMSAANERVAEATKALVNAFSREIEAATQRLSEATGNVAQARARLEASYTASVDAINKSIEAANESVTNASKALADAFAREIDAAAERLSNANKAVDSARAKLQSAYERQVEQITSAIESANDKVADAGEALANAFEREIGAISKRLDAATTAVNQARDNLQASYDRQVAEISEGMIAANEAVARAREAIEAAFSREIDAATKRLEMATSNVGRARQRLEQSYNAELSRFTDMLEAAASRVSSARNVLSQAYERESSALQDTISRLESFTETLLKFKEELTTGAIAGLSPEDQLTANKKAFESAVASGDADRITSTGRAYLDASRDYNASSAAYYATVDEVKKAVDNALAASEGQLSEAQKQLSALEASVSGLLQVDASVISVRDAIAELRSALLNQTAVEAANDAHIAALNASVAGLLDVNESVIGVGQAIAELQTAIAAEAQASEELALLTAQRDAVLATGETLLSIDAAIAALASATVTRDFVQAQGEAQLAALNASVGGLLEVNDSVLSVGAAIAALQLATTNRDDIQAELDLMTATRNAVIGVGETELSIAQAQEALAKALSDRAALNSEAQLEALNASVAGLLDVTNATLSVAEAVSLLQSAQAAQVVAQTELDALNAQREATLGNGETLLTIAQATAAVEAAVNNRDRLTAEGQAQLASLEASVAGLLTVNDSVISVGEAVDALKAAVAAEATARAQLETLTAQRDLALASNETLLTIAQATAAVEAAVRDRDTVLAQGEAQLAALDASVAGLLTVNSAVLGVGEAIAQLQTATAAQAALQAQLDALAAQRDIALASGETLLSIAEATAAVEAAVRDRDKITTEGQAQLAILDATVGALLNVDRSVLSVGEAVALLQSATAAEGLAQTELDALNAQRDAVLVANDNIISVRDAITALEAATASRDLAVAYGEAELKKLDETVGRLIQLNESTTDVAAAIRDLQTARDAQAQAKDALAAILAQRDAVLGTGETLLSIEQGISDLEEAVRNRDEYKIEAERQLTELRATVGNLIDLNGNVIGVSQAIAQLQTARDAQTAAQAALDALQRQRDAVLGTGETLLSIEDGITALEAAVRDRDAIKAENEAQLDALRDSVGAIIDLNGGVLTVEEAIRNLLTAQEAEALALREIDALNASVAGYLTLNESVLSVKDAITALQLALQAKSAAEAALLAELERLKNAQTTTTPVTPVVTTPTTQQPTDTTRPKVTPGFNAQEYYDLNADVQAAYQRIKNDQRNLDRVRNDYGIDVSTATGFAQFHYNEWGRNEQRQFYNPANYDEYGQRRSGIDMPPVGSPANSNALPASDPAVLALLEKISADLADANTQRGAVSTEQSAKLDDVAEGLERVSRELSRSVA
jgi:hypothetical protein